MNLIIQVPSPVSEGLQVKMLFANAISYTYRYVTVAYLKIFILALQAMWLHRRIVIITVVFFAVGSWADYQPQSANLLLQQRSTSAALHKEAPTQESTGSFKVQFACILA